MSPLPPLPLLIFGLTYLGLALGRVPGLRLDRTGFAILGAVAFLATGGLTLDQAKDAVDAPTVVVLFGLMLLSAQYRLAGLYTVIGRRLAAVGSARGLLLGTILVSAGLSAVLTNDVVCFALAPLLGAALLRSGRNPLPYLLAIACASNIGSALTPIGNPQNILVAQALDLEFLPFVRACALPVAVSLAFTYWFLARRIGAAAPLAVGGDAGRGGDAVAEAPGVAEALGEEVPLDRREAAKAIVLTAATLALFVTPVPAHLTALGLAGVVLTSRRMRTRDMLALVDWQLLALFAALFTVVRGLELSGWVDAAGRWLQASGADLARPAVNAPAVVVLGNLVGNVPAVMLLLPFVPRDAATGHGLALVSTFAGNALLVGSIANLIVAQQAERLGVRFGFGDHLRVGLPITAVSLAAAAAAIALW